MSTLQAPQISNANIAEYRHVLQAVTAEAVLRTAPSTHRDFPRTLDDTRELCSTAQRFCLYRPIAGPATASLWNAATKIEPRSRCSSLVKAVKRGLVEPPQRYTISHPLRTKPKLHIMPCRPPKAHVCPFGYAIRSDATRLRQSRPTQETPVLRNLAAMNCALPQMLPTPRMNA